MFRKYLFILGLTCSLILGACIPSQMSTSTVTPLLPTEVIPTPLATTLPPVTLAGSELRSLHSAKTGRDYDIYILLPASYAQNEGKSYPVLYVLDGQWDFKLYDSIYGGLYYDQFIPEIVIVGITYSGSSPDYDRLRAMDLTPLKVNYHPGSGDAPKFLAFIKEELFPLIEANYRVDPARRVLSGSSYGGLFTLYALFTEPSLFSGYISGSPAITYGSFIIRDLEEAYAGQHQDLPVKLFVGVGELEDLRFPVESFVQTIQEHKYDGLMLEARVFEGERHASNKPEAFNRGLRFIFQNK